MMYYSVVFVAAARGSSSTGSDLQCASFLQSAPQSQAHASQHKNVCGAAEKDLTWRILEGHVSL